MGIPGDGRENTKDIALYEVLCSSLLGSLLDSYCNFCESKGMLKVKLYHLIANTKLERDICENSDCSLALEHVTGYLVGFPQIYL